MAIKLRYYCKDCLERRESEIIYDKDGKPFVKSLRLGVTAVDDFHFILDGPLICPNKHCGRPIEPYNYKIIRDRPERYIDKQGWLRTREYKEF